MWSSILPVLCRYHHHHHHQKPSRQKLLRIFTSRWSSSSGAEVTKLQHHHHHHHHHGTPTTYRPAAPSTTPKQRTHGHLPYSLLSRRFESTQQSSQSCPEQQQQQQQQCSNTILLPDPTLVNARHCPVDFTESSAVVYRNVITDDEATSLVQELSVKLQRRRYERGHWDAVIIKYKEMELVDEESVLSATSRAVLQRIRQLLEQQHLPHKINQNHSSSSPTSSSPPTPPLWLPCHVIELAKTGELNAHVDSVRFSGDIVAGLSLQSDSIMRLALPAATSTENKHGDEDQKSNPDHNHNHSHHQEDESEVATAPMAGSSIEHDDNSNKLSFVDLHLIPKSLYVLSGPSRYRYTHELLPDGATFFGSNGSDTNGNCCNEHGTVVNRQDRLSIIFRDARQTEHV